MTRPRDPRLDAPLRRGFYYLRDPDAPGDTPRWVKRPCGVFGRVEVADATGAALPTATLLRAAAAVGAALEAGGQPARAVRVILGPSDRPLDAGVASVDADGIEVLTLPGRAVAAATSWRAVDRAVAALLSPRPDAPARFPAAGALPSRPARRALFFESLMNTAADHNDQELSQGVLHMLSALSATATEPVLARVKMTIHQQFRRDAPELPLLSGLEDLPRALAAGPVELVCVTLLEAYFDQVTRLIAALRSLGCRAHVAVGGVMPTLTPEHVAAHLPDVSFVCRGAGEYFLPALTRILGEGADVDTPLTAAQRAALADLDGLVAVDRAGGRLVVGHSARAVQVEDLDAVPLDLAHLRRDHLVHGIEISTSRGCVHRCSFCTIVGQMTWQGRSADGIFALLDGYHRRFRELYGDAVPNKVFRVHISDDDFACDRERAIDFFSRLRETPFRLASCQVAISDLCERRGATLLPVPDAELLDAIDPRCFFDSARPIPDREYIEDHGPRRWSAHLQLGVESFVDEELRRHAKGYRVAHIRAVVGAAAARGIHLDAYFILSNVQTTAEELVEGLLEASRLKLRHPVHFHVKHPVTPRLVSIFPSASYRRHLRADSLDALALDRVASVPGHGELDYPFVAHDRPRDALVDHAVDRDFFTHDARYTASLARLGDIFRERLATLSDPAERRRAETLVRATDDATRALVFEYLAERGVGRGVDAVPAAREALATALELLGPHASWLPAFRRHVLVEPLVIVVAPDADDGVLARAVACAAASRRPDVVVRVAPTRAAVARALALPRVRVEAAVEVLMTEDSPEAAIAEARAALGGGDAERLVVRAAPGPWGADAQRALATALPRLAALGVPLEASAALLPELRVGADGALTTRTAGVPGAPAGHLDDLSQPDRLVLDAPAGRPSAAERLLASFLAHVRAAATAR